MKRHYTIGQNTPSQAPNTVPIQHDESVFNPLRTTPLVAQINHRFTQIEETLLKHQEHNEIFNQRLLNLESMTHNTDTKIDMILNKMENITSSKQRKLSGRPDTPTQDCTMHENDHPASHQYNQNTGCTQPCL